MTTYRLRTFADIIAAVREELGISSSESEAIKRIKRDINMVYGEVVGEHRWWWLSRSVSIPHQAYISSGTCAVTTGSSTVTLSAAVSGDRRGQKFAVDAYGEIYEIESSDGTTVKLTTPYTGTTASTAQYKIWSDRVPLPVDCKETVEVWHDHSRSPLENVGLQEFRRIRGQAPRADGKPAIYYTTEFNDPIGASSISGMPALTSRSSAGVVKTLVFASSVPSEVVEGARIRVREAGQAGYNGDFTVVAVSTTNSANDTVVYVGASNEEEDATSDTAASVLLLSSPKETRRFRELLVHPALVSTRVTLHVDYIRQADDLENDEDEPILPVEDRMVLLYGALHKAWARMRNPEETARNLSLYQQKIQKMSGKNTDTFDNARLAPSRHYLNAKRWGRKASGLGGIGSAPMGAGAGGAVVTGTPNSVATFNANGEIEGVGAVTPTELGYIGTLTSDAQTQLDALDTRLDTAEADIASLDSDLSAHLSDSSDAHDASAISVAAISGLTATDVQAALSEHQGEIDTNTTTISDHLADTSDAHDASAISVVAGGNLAATDVQAALTELQSDIDTRATASALTTHEADTTSIHGIADTSLLLTTTGTQTATNKTLNSAVLNTPTIDVAVFTGQSVTPSLPGAGNGKLYFDSSGRLYKVNSSGTTELGLTGASLLNVTSKTANYTATSSDDLILCNASGGAFTITLPAAASNTGKVVLIKKTDSSVNAVTVDGNASETIDGTTTRTLGAQYATLEIVSDGTNWVSVDGESVNARYTTAAGASIANNTWTRIDFGTKSFDSHAAVTTGASWAFTAPVAGKYQVSAKCTLNYVNDTSYTGIKIQKTVGGSTSDYSVSNRFWQASGAGSAAPSVAVISDLVDCSAGDIISIWFLQNTASSRNLTATATENTVSIAKVGN
jgi:hypothetical protein